MSDRIEEYVEVCLTERRRKREGGRERGEGRGRERGERERVSD